MSVPYIFAGPGEDLSTVINPIEKPLPRTHFYAGTDNTVDWPISIVGDFTEMWVTAKRRERDSDANCLFQASLSGGLLLLKGADTIDSSWALIIPQDGYIRFTILAYATNVFTYSVENAILEIKIRYTNPDTLVHSVPHLHDVNIPLTIHRLAGRTFE